MARAVAKSLFHSSLGVAAQVLGNVVVFIVFARALGPEAFGRFVVYYAVVSFLGILLDYGYSQRGLRDYRKESELYGGLRLRIFYLKGLVFVIQSFVAMMVIFLVQAEAVLFFVLFFYVSFLAFANSFAAALRADGLYGVDSANLFIAYTFSAGAAFSAYILGVVSPVVYAFILCAGGGGYLILSFMAYRRIGSVVREACTLKSLKEELRDGLPYAGDVMVQRAFVYLDVMILSFMLTPVFVGLYQAGQKLMQAILPLAQAFNNVFIPFLVRGGRYRSLVYSGFVVSSMLGVGLIGLTVFLLFGSDIVLLVYGEEYIELAEFVWVYGLVVCFRFLAFSLSVLLTASGRQSVRLKANTISLIGFFLLAPILVLRWGVVGMVYALVASSVISAFLYALGLRKVFLKAGVEN